MTKKLLSYGMIAAFVVEMAIIQSFVPASAAKATDTLTLQNGDTSVMMEHERRRRRRRRRHTHTEHETEHGPNHT